MTVVGYVILILAVMAVLMAVVYLYLASGDRGDDEPDEDTAGRNPTEW